MSRIEVEALGGERFRVRVRGAEQTGHEVTARAADVQRYGGDVAAEALIEASFAFLLEREPASAILRRFELPVIERYFPEYPQAMRERFTRGAV